MLHKRKKIELKICKNKKAATSFVFEVWEGDIETKSWDAPTFFTRKKHLYQELSERFQKSKKVIKRAFRIQEAIKDKERQERIKYDNRPIFSVDMMKAYIRQNKDAISESIYELNELKANGNRELWHVKANSLVQKVCNNDFRQLTWKEIYEMTKELSNTKNP